RLQQLFGAASRFVEGCGNEVFQHFHVGSGAAEAGHRRRVDGDLQDFLLAVHLHRDGPAAGRGFDNALAELLLHLLLHLFGLPQHFLKFEWVHDFAPDYSLSLRSSTLRTSAWKSSCACLTSGWSRAAAWMLPPAGRFAAEGGGCTAPSPETKESFCRAPMERSASRQIFSASAFIVRPSMVLRIATSTSMLLPFSIQLPLASSTAAVLCPAASSAAVAASRMRSRPGSAAALRSIAGSAARASDPAVTSAAGSIDEDEGSFAGVVPVPGDAAVSGAEDAD